MSAAETLVLAARPGEQTVRVQCPFGPHWLIGGVSAAVEHQVRCQQSFYDNIPWAPRFVRPWAEADIARATRRRVER